MSKPSSINSYWNPISPTSSAPQIEKYISSTRKWKPIFNPSTTSLPMSANKLKRRPMATSVPRKSSRISSAPTECSWKIKLSWSNSSKKYLKEHKPQSIVGSSSISKIKKRDHPSTHFYTLLIWIALLLPIHTTCILFHDTFPEKTILTLFYLRTSKVKIYLIALHYLPW